MIDPKKRALALKALRLREEEGLKPKAGRWLITASNVVPCLITRPTRNGAKGGEPEIEVQVAGERPRWVHPFLVRSSQANARALLLTACRRARGEGNRRGIQPIVIELVTERLRGTGD